MAEKHSASPTSQDTFFHGLGQLRPTRPPSVIGSNAPKAVIGTALFKPGPAYDGHALETVARFSISGNLPHRASHTSSKRQPLKMLLAMIVMPLTYGCQHVADRRW